MAEPASAFLQLRIPRQNLLRWLESPVRPAATWDDWRQIGGSYHFPGGVRDIADISEAVLAANVEECDSGLRTCATNRAALRAMLAAAEARFFRRCTYDEATATFVAGTLTYAENLIRYMQFLTVARGAAEALEADGSGVALIHNYVWAPDLLVKAMTLGPGPASAFAPPDAHRAMIPLFQEVADEMLDIAAEVDEELENAPEPIDVLAKLK